ncbi:TonB-dependent receptor [Flavobacterium daejeonense]|uniref:TonB-dependent receptor n=1 Tax=Flavobacterium daejeonense TaxID=350893 RepID=UPI00068F811F|nr:TonB-dependent receptor [Flavobacterium daejeonense]
MKKTVVKQRLLIRLMKMTLYQFVLALIFSTVATANSLNGQGKLDTKVTISITDMNLNNALKELGKSADVKFSYNSRMVPFDQKVSVKAEGEVLSAVLSRILKPLNITYAVVSNQIVLQKGNALNENQREIEQLKSTSADIIIKGKITDEQGVSLPGATILVKSSGKSTTTDLDGSYSITALDTDVLVISYIGYVSKEISVSGQKIINVSLIEDVSKLEEVVVIGYGEQKRSKISGSVSEISQKEIAKNPTANISNALVGQATGIIARQTTGEPGRDDSDVFIRGVGTTGDASPIYVIDGIVRSARDFSQLNSSEIASFSVLKDAASAAVFGVRGGNGVIMVTTKRGKEGKMQISFSSNFGIQERTREPEFLGSYEYAKLYNEARVNNGDPIVYSDSDLQKFKDGSSPDTHPDVNWMSVLKKTSPIRTSSLSANGGTDKIRYATSISLLDQQGLLDSDDFRRVNFRSNIDADVTNTTKLSFDVSGRDEKINSVAGEEVFRWLVSAKPDLAPIKFSNGGYSSGPAYLTLSDNGYRRKRNQVFQGRIQLEQQLPIDGLSVKGIISYDKTFTDNKNWSFLKIPFYTINKADGTFEESAYGADGASSLYEDHNDYQSITYEAHLNYKKKIGNNDFTGLVLYTQTGEKWNFLSARRKEFKLGIDEMNYGNASTRENGGYSGSSGRQGIVSRVNWTYNEKYTLEASFRADASEQFAPGNRWGYFPSGSFAYVISKEDFLQNVKPINLLKLRGSYGILGNDRLRINNQEQRFLYLQSFNANGNAVFGDADVQQAIAEGRLPSPDVTWETVKKLNIGFDSRLFNNKLSLNFDYFSDKRSDILGQRNLSVPALLGASLPVENLAKVNNRGFEIELGHKNNISDNLSYTINGNFTYTKNKIVFIDEPASDNLLIRRTGNPIGSQQGLIATGLFQSQEEIDNAPHQFNDVLAPGDIRYADINGPDGVPDGVVDRYDETIIGGSFTPEIIYGFNLGIQYKNLELSCLFQGAGKIKQSYGGEASVPFFLGTGPAYVHNLDRWTPDNPDASEPRVLLDGAQNRRGSTFWLRDASYLRLKNVEIAYNVPVKLLKLNLINSARLYVNANNVFTITKIKDFDPENSQGRGWGYPQLRIWNIGLNVNF